MTITSGYTLQDALNAVGPGWASLIKLAYSTFSLIPFSIHVKQVKQKYGTLRIYVEIDGDAPDPINAKNLYKFIPTNVEHLYKFIDVLEVISGMVCSNCGFIPASKDQGKYGYYETLCHDCVSKRN